MKADHTTYSSDALDRLKEAGEKAVLEFIADLSPKAVKDLVAYLPTVSGFRKTSNSGLEQRKKAFAKAFVSSKASSKATRTKADQALYAFWRAWGREHLGDPILVDEAVGSVEKAASDTSFEAGSVQPLVVNLFETLRALSYRNLCARESIERFYEFSPFEESTSIRQAISKAKPSADVARDVALSSLPERLRGDEQEIKSLEGRTRELEKKLTGAIGDIVGLRADLVRVSGALEASVSRPSSSSQDRENASAWDELVQRVTLVDEQLRSIGKSIAELESQPKPFESIDATVALLATLDNRIAEIEASITAPRDSTIGISLDRPFVPPLPIDDVSPAPEKLLRPFNGGRHLVSSNLADLSAVTGQLRQNFEVAGLKPTAAGLLAEEVASAVLSRQIVFFKGPYATDFARLAAIALTGIQTWHAAVPIGLNNSAWLRDEAIHLLSSDDLANSIVLEGLNKIPSDLFVDSLSDISGQSSTVSRVLSETFVFVSLTNGIAALPIETSYLELGPVFDLSHLEWRIRRSALKPAVSGSMLNASLRALRQDIETSKPDGEEVLRLARKFAPRRGPRFESTVMAAFSAISYVAKSRSAPTVLQSIAFGWLAPHWSAIGLTKSDADSELDGGKCDAADIDPRLSGILASDSFAVGRAS